MSSRHPWTTGASPSPASIPAGATWSADPVGIGRVLAVDVDGTAVGLADIRALPVGLGAGKAVTWPADGGMRVLNPPSGYDSAVANMVSGGWIGGAGWRRSDPRQAPVGQPVSVIWDPGAGARQLPAPLWQVGAVNGYGWLTGTNRAHHPLLRAGDRVVSL